MKLPLVELGLRRPLPIEVTMVTLPFWEGLKNQQFLVACCSQCARLSFPPQAYLSWLSRPRVRMAGGIRARSPLLRLESAQLSSDLRNSKPCARGDCGSRGGVAAGNPLIA